MKSLARVPGVTTLALMGGALVFAATAKYGPGLTPDSAEYFSAAQGLRSGAGLLATHGSPYAHFPPLLPVMLAALGALGLEAGRAAAVINAACAALAVAAAGLLVERLTGNRTASLAAALIVVASAPQLEAFSFAMTEALFVAVMMSFFLAMVYAPIEAGGRTVLALGVLAAALPLTRYVGVVIVPAAALALVLTLPAGKRRWRSMVGFSCVAATPLATYLLRNYVVTGRLTGERGPSTASAVSVLRGFVASAADWFVPWGWLMRLQEFSDERWALGLFFLLPTLVAALVLRALYLWLRVHADDVAAVRTLAVMMLWIVGYSAFLCLSALAVAFNPIEPRFLVPLFVPCVVLLAVAVAHSVEHPDRRAFRAVAVATITALIALQVGRVGTLILDKRANGAGGYATTTWQELPFVTWVTLNPPGPEALTNGPDLVFLLTGERRSWVPWSADPEQSATLVRAVTAGDDVEVVWFDDIDWRLYLAPLERLTALPELQVVHAERGGVVLSTASLRR